MLMLIMYVYLVMLHFDVRWEVDKVDVDGVAFWCQWHTQVFVGWRLGTR